MSIELTNTNASKVASALIRARREAGSPTMGMVLTFIVVADESARYDALKAARAVSREHPSRVLGVIRRSNRGPGNLDANIRIGDGTAGEEVLLRMSGELAHYPESVVLPLLLPDSPVVIWWPTKPPENPATDPLGALAQRRITDSAAVARGRAAAMLTQATNYQPGNTDLAWTRITPWRALLAAALDQYPSKVTGGVVAAERLNPSADLLAAWLCNRLKVQIDRENSKGPGITSVELMTGGGAIQIARPDGRLAQFSIPNSPERPVALNRRETAELLAEELRRLDPDDVYHDTVTMMCKLQDNGYAPTKRQLAAQKAKAEEAAALVGTPPIEPGPRTEATAPGDPNPESSEGGTASTELAANTARSKGTAKKAAKKSATAKKTTAQRAKKTTAKNSTKSGTAKKQAPSS